MLKTELERADGSLRESFCAKLSEAAWAGGMFDGNTKGVIRAVDAEKPADVKIRRLIPTCPYGEKSRSFRGVHENATFLFNDRKIEATSRKEIVLDFTLAWQFIVALIWFPSFGCSQIKWFLFVLLDVHGSI